MPLKASATRGSGSSYWPKPEALPFRQGCLLSLPQGKGWRDPRSPHSHARVPRSGMWWTTSADNKQELTQLRTQHFISVLTAWLHPKTQKIKTPWTHGCPLNLSHLGKPQAFPAGTEVPEQCEGFLIFPLLCLSSGQGWQTLLPSPLVISHPIGWKAGWGHFHVTEFQMELLHGRFA